MRTTLLFAALVVANVSSAAVVTWTNTNGGLWSGAANWSGGAVPTAGDDVFITTAGTYSVTQDVHVTVASLTLGGVSGRQTLTNSGTTLVMSGSSAVNSNGVIALNGGTLGGVGPLNVAGRLRSDGGSLGGFRAGSVMVVTPGGRLEMVGGGNHVLWAALTNHGTTEFAAGTLYVQDYTVFFNDADGVLDIQGDRTIAASYNVGSIVNHGVIRKSAGGGVADIQVPLNNSATLDAQVGGIQFSGALTLNEGSLLSGEGTNSLTGNLTLNGTIMSENLILTSGGVGGRGTLKGTAQWQGSQLGSIGSLALVVGSNATLRLSGGVDHVLWGVVTNLGTMEFASGTLYVQGGASFRNAVGGLFDIQGDLTVTANYNIGILVNQGVLRKSASAGTALIQVPIFNSGTLDAQVGQIQYTSTLTLSDGSSIIGAGTNLVTSGAAYLSGSIYSQNLELAAANVYATNTFAGTVKWSNGVFAGPALVTIATNGSFSLCGSAAKGFIGALTNRGVIAWTGAGDFNLASAAIDNGSGARFEMWNDASLVWTGGVQPVFYNAGILRKSAGTHTNLLNNIVLVNRGTVEAQTGTITFNTSGTFFDDGTLFLGAGTNLLAGGSMTLSGAIYSQNLQLAGAAVSGTNTLSGAVRWTSGYIAPDGWVTIATNGTLDITGPALKGINGVLDNRGLVRLSDTGTLGMGSQAVMAGIVNRPGGIFEALSDAPISWTSASMPAFSNAGLFRKSGGSGSTTLSGVVFHNTGTVDVQSGSVVYSASGTRFEGGSQLIGAGTNLLAGGSMTLSGVIYSQNLEIAGAGISGTNTLSGAVRWTSGYIAPDSWVTIATNSTLDITGPGLKGINGVLNNRGLVRLSDVGTLGMGSQTVTATIVNEPGGVFEALSDAPISWTIASTPAFTNAGTFRKSGGSGSTTLSGVVFHNTGTVDVQSGAVVYSASGTRFEGGSQLIGAGTNLLPGVFITLSGPIYSQNLEIAGTGISGTNTLSGAVRWTSGYIAPDGCVTIATNSTLDITGPSLKGINGVLNNRGLVRLSDIGTLGMGSQTVTATIVNEPGGVFEALSDAPISWTIASTPAFTNAGTFRKSGGTGSTTLSGVPFSNSGTVDVQSGTVAFPGGYTQTGGAMRFGLNGLTHFGRVQITGGVPLTGTLAVNLNGGYVPATGNSFAVVTYASQTGAFTGFDLAPQVAWQTNSSIYGPNAVTLTVLNVRPTLGPIGDQTVDEQVLLSFSIAGSDPDAGQSLTYSLLDPPTNATINAGSGLFSWTPSEAQGPSTNLIAVCVADNGSPALSATNTFVVVVNEVNLAPVLAAIPDLTAIQDVPLRYTNSVTDADVPANSFSFDLIAPPSGMTVDAGGVIHWTPSVGQVPSTNAVTARVTDNGVPPGSDTKTFTVVAFPLPRLAIGKAGTNVVLSWPAYAVDFTLQSATNLTRPTLWTDVTNGVAVESDRNVVTNSMGAKERFYRLRHR